MIARAVAWGATAGMLIGCTTAASIALASGSVYSYGAPVLFEAIVGSMAGAALGLLLGLVGALVLTGVLRVVGRPVAVRLLSGGVPAALVVGACAGCGTGAAGATTRTVVTLLALVCAAVGVALGPLVVLEPSRPAVGPEVLIRGAGLGAAAGAVLGAAGGAVYYFVVAGAPVAQTLHGIGIGISTGAVLGILIGAVYSNP